MSMFSIRHISPRGERRELYLLEKTSIDAWDWAYVQWGAGKIRVMPARRTAS